MTDVEVASTDLQAKGGLAALDGPHIETAEFSESLFSPELPSQFVGLEQKDFQTQSIDWIRATHEAWDKTVYVVNSPIWERNDRDGSEDWVRNHGGNVALKLLYMLDAAPSLLPPILVREGMKEEDVARTRQQYATEMLFSAFTADAAKPEVGDRAFWNQTGKITDETKSRMRSHVPLIANRLVRFRAHEERKRQASTAMGVAYSPVEISKLEQDGILGHHEREDGSGYPRGLRSTETNFTSGVLAVADEWAAWEEDRPQRERPLTNKEAFTEVRRQTKYGKMDEYVTTGKATDFREQLSSRIVQLVEPHVAKIGRQTSHRLVHPTSQERWNVADLTRQVTDSAERVDVVTIGRDGSLAFAQDPAFLDTLLKRGIGASTRNWRRANANTGLQNDTTEGLDVATLILGQSAMLSEAFKTEGVDLTRIMNAYEQDEQVAELIRELGLRNPHIFDRQGPLPVLLGARLFTLPIALSTGRLSDGEFTAEIAFEMGSLGRHVITAWREGLIAVLHGKGSGGDQGYLPIPELTYGIVESSGDYQKDRSNGLYGELRTVDQNVYPWNIQLVHLANDLVYLMKQNNLTLLGALTSLSLSDRWNMYDQKLRNLVVDAASEANRTYRLTSLEKIPWIAGIMDFVRAVGSEDRNNSIVPRDTELAKLTDAHLRIVYYRALSQVRRAYHQYITKLDLGGALVENLRYPDRGIFNTQIFMSWVSTHPEFFSTIFIRTAGDIEDMMVGLLGHYLGSVIPDEHSTLKNFAIPDNNRQEKIVQSTLAILDAAGIDLKHRPLVAASLRSRLPLQQYNDPIRESEKEAALVASMVIYAGEHLTDRNGRPIAMISDIDEWDSIVHDARDVTSTHIQNGFRRASDDILNAIGIVRLSRSPVLSPRAVVYSV